MGVLDGQQISASITNAAFLNKNQADQMTFPVSFTKTLSLSKRNESSGATLNAMDSSQSLVNITGTVTTINGATAPTSYADGATLIIANSSASTVTVSHESGSATAANRFSLSGNAPLLISPGLAAQFFYNTTDSRWHQMAGVGSGSGSGLKNYITYSDFEGTGTTGWSLAASTLDATTKLPNQASGSWAAAAATLSFTTVGSGSQLAGNTSGSLVSSAATTAGNMLVTDALTLDLEAQASIQTWSFFYKIASGASNGNFSGTSSNSIGVAIYDVTNSAWIQPAGVFNIVQSSLVGKASGTFQVPSNCTSVRLAIYFPNATTGAITVYIDDVVLGPQVVQYGAPVSDWIDFPSVAAGTLITATTTSPTFGTVAYNKAQWRKVGSDMEIRWDFRQTTAGTAGNGTYLFNLPPGYQIDSTKAAINASFGESKSLGIIQSFNGTAALSIGYVYARTATQLAATVQYNDGSTAYGTGSWSSSTSNFSDALRETSICAKVPISGWSSSVVFSNDTDTRIVDLVINPTSSITPSGTIANAFGSATTINWNTTPTKDSHSIYSAGVMTIPVAGDYSCAVKFETQGTGGTFWEICYVVNGTQVAENAIKPTANNQYLFGTVLIPNLKAGDLLTIRLRSDCVAPVFVASLVNSLVLFRLSGPSVIAATDTVACSYTNGAGTALTSSYDVKPFPTRVFDTTGSYNTTTGVWTCPVSGKYRAILRSHATTGTTASIAVRIRKNSTDIAASLRYGNGLSIVLGETVTTSIDLVAGDTLDFVVRTPSSTTMYADALFNQIEISRIGN